MAMRPMKLGPPLPIVLGIRRRKFSLPIYFCQAIFKNQGAYGCRFIFKPLKLCNILCLLQIQLNLGNVGYHIVVVR
jgi:hypothetical protein